MRFKGRASPPLLAGRGCTITVSSGLRGGDGGVAGILAIEAQQLKAMTRMSAGLGGGIAHHLKESWVLRAR